MPKKSVAVKNIRKAAGEIPSATPADLDRLRSVMKGKIDTGEIPERRKFNRIQREATGNLPPRVSIIREAVVQQMHRLNLTAYRLWQLARAHYPQLSQSAVHEFLKGQRQLELPSVEALLVAADLRVARKSGGPRQAQATMHRSKKGVG
jgi:hypothetical protein